MLWEKQKLIFLHIPKTAGTSIQDLLKEQLGEHDPKIETHFDYEKLSKLRKLSEYDIFTVIRHPLDRAVSWYHWIEQGWGWDVGTFKEMMQTKRLFNEKYVQSKFIEQDVHVIKFENLIPELDYYLNEKLGLGIDMSKMPHIGKTKREHYSKYYTAPWMTDKVLKYDEEVYNKYYRGLDE